MGVQHLFDSSGNWIAFRRHANDRFLFDTDGEWIGWFPWGDDEAVDTNGEYLGTLKGRNRFYRQNSYRPYRGYPGYPGYPGYAGYPGYPGYAGYQMAPFGFADIPNLKRT